MTIPTELTRRKQWVNWRYGDLRQDGKRAKEPIIPGTDRKASSTNPATWGTYEDAKDDFRLGYVFTKEDGHAGIDLDHCIEDKQVLPWAKKIVQQFDSYTEISPSQTGLHILVRTSDLLSIKRGDIEIYTHDRYFTMTGWRIAGPTAIEDRTELLNKFHEKVSSPQGVEGPIMSLEANKPPPAKQPLPSQKKAPPVEDKWTLLAAGKWEGMGYSSQSEADLAYANHLRGTTKQDRERAEELFRESGLYTSREPKEAERKLEMTFNKAFKDVAERTPLRRVMFGHVVDEVGEQKWTWKHWIPEGQVTMIAAPQAVGKSYLAAYLAAVMVGAKDKWPDGSFGPKEPLPVLVIESEGMQAEWGRRLKRMGVDIYGGLVSLVAQSEEEWYIGPELDNSRFIWDLAALALEDPPAKALIIDSLSGGHTIDENSDKMKKLLKPLTLLAAQLNIPVIVVHHFRKQRESETAKAVLDKIRGSTTITQFCRSVIGMCVPDPENETVLVQPIKSNLCKIPDGVGMSITGGDEAGRLKFGPPPQLVVKKSKSQIAEAKEFLRLTLKEGPKDRVQVYKEAEVLGIHKKAVQRARVALEIPAALEWELPTFIHITGESDA